MSVARKAGTGRTMVAAPSRAAAGRGASRGLSLAGALARAGTRVLARHPGRSFAGLALSVGIGAVLWNALLHQANRHPAPLFAGEPSRPSRLASPQAAAIPAALPPLPVRRPDPTQVGSLAASGELAIAPRSAAADPIGGMIRATEPTAAKPTAAKPATAAASAAKPPADPPAEGARIAAAQKALAKLGYGPLKPDGVLGTTTRQAVERFERDRSLPVTGILAGRTVRQLAQSSGVSVE